jgi:hypothetical protein
VGAPAPQGDDDRRARWGATTRCATAEKHFVLMHVGELFARADAGNRGHWTISAGDSSFELWLSRKPRRTFVECREMAMNGGRAGRNGRYEGGPPGQRGPQREAARYEGMAVLHKGQPLCDGDNRMVGVRRAPTTTFGDLVRRGETQSPIVIADRAVRDRTLPRTAQMCAAGRSTGYLKPNLVSNSC